MKKCEQFSIIMKSVMSSLVAQIVKNLPAMRKTWAPSLGWEDHLEKGMSTHSSILAWRIPWTEEPGRLQSMKSMVDSNRCFLSVMENRGENPERNLSLCHHSPTKYLYETMKYGFAPHSTMREERFSPYTSWVSHKVIQF